MKEFKNHQDKVKHLQNLYSWAQLYKETKRDNEHSKIQQEIQEFKKQHKLY